ncbi:MAG: phosphate acyltransferase PlsX [Nitrospirae bacterium]|nr:MAG: phosphate acyltransferase PlsX [Nitrospirota bacterium]
MTRAEGLPIALDAVGGDHAPEATVQGALEAVEKLGLPVLLVGPSRTIRRELGRFRRLPDGLAIVDAPDVVTMEDPPVAVLRRKRRSSLTVCAELVRDGQASAMVTAGNTGAAWVAAKARLGMIEGVERPALAAILPSTSGHTLVLDVGANVECRPHHLVQFAVMGSRYAELALGVPRPRVGLLSIGEEEGKGGRRVAEGHRSLAEAGVNFVGNVEGRDIFTGDVDVVVCDGFTGNVVLKVAEGVGEFIVGALREAARRSPVYGAGLLMAKGAFRDLKRRVDYAEYGGAPLLGVAGPVLIGHGRSSARAIRNAIRAAHAYATAGVVAAIAEDARRLGSRGRGDDDA